MYAASLATAEPLTTTPLSPSSKPFIRHLFGLAEESGSRTHPGQARCPNRI